MHADSHARSIAKTLSYRVLGSCGTAVICFAITGEVVVSLGAGAADVVMKLGLYFLHERLWNNIGFGRPRQRSMDDYQI